MKKVSAMLASAITFLLATHAQATPAGFDKLQGLNHASGETVRAEALDRDLHIFLRLPESHGTSDQLYPTIYLLDGGVTFPLLAGYYRYLQLGGEIPEMIIVGLSYGASSFADGNTRSSDFTAPAPDRAHYGGAAKLQQFFRAELLPMIEGRYKADPARRILFGQSLGGQFVLHAAQTEPGLFWGHIASNPALHRNLPFFLGNVPLRSDSNVRLFVASGSLDDERFRTPALAWIDHWQDKPVKPWALKTVTLDGHGHFSAAPAAFRQGLHWLFSEP